MTDLDLIKTISKLELKKGNILIVESDRYLNAEIIDRFRKTIEGVLEKVGIQEVQVIIAEGVKFKVLEQKE